MVQGLVCLDRGLQSRISLYLRNNHATLLERLFIYIKNNFLGFFNRASGFRVLLDAPFFWKNASYHRILLRDMPYCGVGSAGFVGFSGCF